MFDVALSSLALKWSNASLYLFLVKFVHSVFFSLFPKLITELKPLDEKLKSEEKLLLTQSQIPEQNGKILCDGFICAIYVVTLKLSLVLFCVLWHETMAVGIFNSIIAPMGFCNQRVSSEF